MWRSNMSECKSVSLEFKSAVRLTVVRCMVTSVLLACTLLASDPVTASARLYGQGLLWKIEGRGYEPSYLFGTMHVTDERVLQLPEAVLKAFEASRRCIFELVVPEDGGPWDSIPKQTLPNNLHLSTIIGDAAYNKVVIAAGRYGIPTGQIEKIHPAALFAIFNQPANEWLRRSAGWAFLDQALQNEARALGKPLHALETMAEQIAISDQRYGGVDIGTLISGMIDHSFKTEQAREVMIQHYLRRDLDAIFDQQQGIVALLPTAERQAYKAFQALLLDNRNVHMAERSEKHLAVGRAFIAVGAAHLPGKKGVLRLLEERGYKVTRIY